METVLFLSRLLQNILGGWRGDRLPLVFSSVGVSRVDPWTLDQEQWLHIEVSKYFGFQFILKQKILPQLDYKRRVFSIFFLNKLRSGKYPLGISSNGIGLHSNSEAWCPERAPKRLRWLPTLEQLTQQLLSTLIWS